MGNGDESGPAKSTPRDAGKSGPSLSAKPYFRVTIFLLALCICGVFFLLASGIMRGSGNVESPAVAKAPRANPEAIQTVREERVLPTVSPAAASGSIASGGAATAKSPPGKQFSFAEGLLDQLKRQKLKAEREAKRQEQLDIIANETTSETILNLMNLPMEDFSLSIGSRSAIRLGPLVAAMLREPRVEKLLETAAAGDEGQRKALVAELSEAISQALETLPASVPSGDPWWPNIAHSDGLDAYAVVLSEIDREASSLPLLSDLYTARQDALHARFRSDLPELSASPVILSHGADLTVYACEKLLNRYLEDPQLRAALSPAQAAALEQFAEYESTRAPKSRLDSEDYIAIVEFATQIIGGR